ncbi:MAG: LCP family protein [Micromonosporaceae bacterium]
MADGDDDRYERFSLARPPESRPESRTPQRRAPGPSGSESGEEHIPAPRPGRYPRPANPPGPPRRTAEAAQRRLMARIAVSRKARRQRALLVASGLLSALVLAVSGGAWALAGYVNGGVGRVDAGTAGVPPSGPLNILLAGVDRRAGLTAAQEAELHVGHDVSLNSDTMMLVHVSAGHNAVTVVSLPRDSWVTIPGHGMSKINAAYGLGGPKLMVQTVEQATGITIDSYVEVNFLGFVKVINALGGVDICLPQAISDPSSGLSLPAGRHHVDGITALKYARDRHSFATEDLARIGNQQRLLASLLAEAISGGTLANPMRLSAFLNASLAAVKVDRGLNVTALAGRMRNISASDVTFTTVPIANANYLTPDGQSAVLWDNSAAGRLFDAIRSDQRLIKPVHKAQRHRVPVYVDVYNGTLIGGLSSSTGTQLSRFGFHVRAGLTWPHENVGQTVIEYPPGQRAAAQLVKGALRDATLKKQNGLSRIRVVLGAIGYEVTGPAQGGSPVSGQIKARTAAQNACR